MKSKAIQLNLKAQKSSFPMKSMSSMSSGSCLISWFTNLTSIGWKRSLTGSSTSTGTGSREAALRQRFFNRGGCFRRHGCFIDIKDTHEKDMNCRWYLAPDSTWLIITPYQKTHERSHTFFLSKPTLCDLSVRCTMYGCRVSMLTAPSLGTSSLSRNQICKGLEKNVVCKGFHFPIGSIGSWYIYLHEIHKNQPFISR